jgi:hypothetical protein
VLRPEVRRPGLLLVLTALVAAGALGATAPSSTGTGARVQRAARRPGAAAVVRPHGAASGDPSVEPRLYLAWGAPYGTPGASRNLDLTCADTSKVDTLYLSFEMGTDGEQLLAMFARISFHPVPGDTLGAFWDFGRKGVNPQGLKIQFDPDGTFPCSQPWNRMGSGYPSLRRWPGGMRLELMYSVSVPDAIPISGRTRYCYARLLLDRKMCRLAGSRQPVCIEWEQARCSVGKGGNIVPGQTSHTYENYITGKPEALVSVNSPDSSVCAPCRGATRVRAWWSRRQLPPAMGDSSGRPGATRAR